MPKKKAPQLTPKEQFKRFVETAREHDVDLSPEGVDKVVKKIVRTQDAPKPRSK
jgi:phosphosulfolactate synthase (CoM biosynthesis protein A)